MKCLLLHHCQFEKKKTLSWNSTKAIRKTTLSIIIIIIMESLFHKFTPPWHKPLHLFGVKCIGPVAALLKMRADNDPVGMYVAFKVVVCYSRTNQHWDLHRLRHFCMQKKRNRILDFTIHTDCQTTLCTFLHFSIVGGRSTLIDWRCTSSSCFTLCNAGFLESQSYILRDYRQTCCRICCTYQLSLWHSKLGSEAIGFNTCFNWPLQFWGMIHGGLKKQTSRAELELGWADSDPNEFVCTTCFCDEWHPFFANRCNISTDVFWKFEHSWGWWAQRTKCPLVWHEKGNAHSTQRY